jgi:serine/threonine protein phosphatase PrpC
MIVLDAHKDNGDHPPTGLFGVFDGHGGKEVARFAAAHLVSCRGGRSHARACAAD